MFITSTLVCHVSKEHLFFLCVNLISKQSQAVQKWNRLTTENLSFKFAFVKGHLPELLLFLDNIRIQALVIALALSSRVLVIFLHSQLSEGRYKTGYQSKDTTAPLAIRTTENKYVGNCVNLLPLW